MYICLNWRHNHYYIIKSKIRRYEVCILKTSKKAVRVRSYKMWYNMTLKVYTSCTHSRWLVEHQKGCSVEEFTRKNTIRVTFRFRRQRNDSFVLLNVINLSVTETVHIRTCFIILANRFLLMTLYIVYLHGSKRYTS